jgi:threonine dehydrogenase-like Zn-dependent dehydrogenase
VRKAGPLRGRRVVVLSAGPIGLLVLVAARHAGAERMAVTDLLASKRERAVRMRADAALPADDPDLVGTAHKILGGPAEAVFDYVTRERSLAVRRPVGQGRAVVVVGVGVAAGRWYAWILVSDREIRIEGALMYVPKDFYTAIDLMHAGAVDVSE